MVSLEINIKANYRSFFCGLKIVEADFMIKTKPTPAGFLCENVA